MQTVIVRLCATLLVVTAACGGSHATSDGQGFVDGEDECGNADDDGSGSSPSCIGPGFRIDAGFPVRPMDASIWHIDAARAMPGDASVVAFVPEDNSTNIGSASLGLSVVSFAPGASAQSVLDELSDSLELVHWPSAQRVPAHVALQDAGLTTLTIAPDEPLTGGWYALRLDVAEGLVEVPPLGAERLQGFYTSRFRIDSAPVVQRIELCMGDRSPYDGKLTVYFSENVDSELDADAVSFTDVSDVPAQDVSVVDCKQLRGLGSDRLEFSCTNLFLSFGKLNVTFNEFKSTMGVALKDVSGAEPTYTFDPTTLPAVDACQVFVPWR